MSPLLGFFTLISLSQGILGCHFSNEIIQFIQDNGIKHVTCVSANKSNSTNVPQNEEFIASRTFYYRSIDLQDWMIIDDSDLDFSILYLLSEPSSVDEILTKMGKLKRLSTLIFIHAFDSQMILNQIVEELSGLQVNLHIYVHLSPIQQWNRLIKLQDQSKEIRVISK